MSFTPPTPPRFPFNAIALSQNARQGRSLRIALGNFCCFSLCVYVSGPNLRCLTVGHGHSVKAATQNDIILILRCSTPAVFAHLSEDVDMTLERD